MRAHLKKRNFAGLMPVYIADFFFFFHINSLAYINSSFLLSYFSPTMVGLLYVLGAVGNIFLLFSVYKLEKHLGNRGVFSFFLLAEFLALSGLIFSSTPIALAIFFIIFMSTALGIIYSLDIFLEASTIKSATGSVRGVYLTIGNIALVLSPLLIALVAPGGEFTRLYTLSILFLLPLFYLASHSFKHFKDGKQRFAGLPFNAWINTKNIRRVTGVRFTLDLFYSFMVIYMPIYLREIIGFNWTEISIIFTIMLLPFALFEIPIGRLADRWCGEKEFMTIGLFIIGITLIFIPILKEASVILWTILLFSSRVGASIVEITAESYFFKHVDKRDVGLISIYRMTGPIALIVGAALGSITISLLPFEIMFLILAVIILKAIDTSSKLQDTL